MTKSDNFIEPRKNEPLHRRRRPESAALPLMGRFLIGQPKEPPTALFAVRSGRAALTKARQRRPVPPSVAQTRGREGPQINVRPRIGKPMPMHTLSAHALSGGPCRRCRPESGVAQSGSAVCGADSWERGASDRYTASDREAHANARHERSCSEWGPLRRRRGPESAVALWPGKLHNS